MAMDFYQDVAIEQAYSKPFLFILHLLND